MLDQYLLVYYLKNVSNYLERLIFRKYKLNEVVFQFLQSYLDTKAQKKTR